MDQNKSWTKTKVGPKQKLGQNKTAAITAAITIPITTVKKAEMTAAMTVAMKNIQIQIKFNSN